MKELINKDDINIENKIYEVRGMQVMLDSDIAQLYHVETKRVNEAVSRNPEKFPERFSWRLTENETNDLRSQFATANLSSMSRITPQVFTEQGLYMLATILKSSVAVKVSIAIMDTFVKMRHYINYNQLLLPNKILLLEDKVDRNTAKINELFDKFNPNDIVKDKLFFEGEFYDSYSAFIDILFIAKKEIIIIDNYAGKKLLDMIKDVNRDIIIVSSNMDETLTKKYRKQYDNVRFIKNESFHDRFIVLDRKRLFMCGTSFKDIGKKCFVISEMNDTIFLPKILKDIGL